MLSIHLQSAALLAGFLALLAAASFPVGRLLTAVARDRAPRWAATLDARLMRASGLDREAGFTPLAYGAALLAFNVLGFEALFLMLRFQGHLPINPTAAPDMPWATALHTAASFVTNTNQQFYAGESAVSALTQTAGLLVQNVLSAATGIAFAFAFIRAVAQRCTREAAQENAPVTVGNPWRDLLRIVLWVLLPLGVFFGVGFMVTGVPQTRSLPVAAVEALKMLGTNGGGVFAANSAHPLEYPGHLSNLFSILGMLLIPSALTRVYGRMVGKPAEGRTLWWVMAVVFSLAYAAVVWIQAQGGNLLTSVGAAPAAMPLEGTKLRFTLPETALFTTATTGASCGAVNMALDGLAPGASAAPLLLMLLGEVVFGGVGTGLTGMIVMVLLCVVLAGQMVGRSPEYLGRKLDPAVMKRVAFAILAVPVIVLIGSALTVLMSSGVGTTLTTTGTPAHVFTQILWAWASAANNNGSGFAGLVPGKGLMLSLTAAMILGRAVPMAILLSLADVLGRLPNVGTSTARRGTAAAALGTLPTSGVVFGAFLTGVLLLLGGLTYFPAVALGPLAEAFSSFAGL